jgi:hypothetical protein
VALLSLAPYYLGKATHGRSPYPPPPDRWSLMTTPWHFQGLRVPGLPMPSNTGWFEPALAWVAKSDRPAVYATKDAAGDRLYGLSLSGAYLEPGQPYEQYPGVDFSQDLASLNALVDEILTGSRPGQPRAIRLFLAGDDQGAGPGYNDPVGRTYGHDWLMANFERVAASLGPRAQYIQFIPGYDAIFYGWSPAQVAAFGSLFDAVVRVKYPHAVLALEHGIGHPPLGDGALNYGVGTQMAAYDIVASEYNGQGGDTQCLVHDDNVWQINGRLRYPDDPYNRPPDQPAGDDPNPPGYFADSARGPILHECMEWAIYEDVRGWCTPAGIENDRAYLRAMVPHSRVA